MKPIKMEYKGLSEFNQEIPTRGRYTKIGLQAIKDFQNRNIKTAKIDITYTNEQELKALYNAPKSLARRRKNTHKDSNAQKQDDK